MRRREPQRQLNRPSARRGVTPTTEAAARSTRSDGGGYGYTVREYAVKVYGRVFGEGEGLLF